MLSCIGVFSELPLSSWLSYWYSYCNTNKPSLLWYW